MKISNLDTAVRKKYGISRLTRADIENIQLDALNRVLAAEKRRNGFYGGLPEKICDLRELETLPFTTHEDLAARGGAMLILSQAEISRVITDRTSGTTGAAKRVFYTRGDCLRTVELFKAGLSELVYPGGKTMICMPFSGQFGLGELIAQAISELGAEPIKAGPDRTFGEYRDILKLREPDTFVGFPVQLLSILRCCGRGSLRRALVSGDTCTPAMTELIEAYNLPLYPHYGSREMALGGAVSCQARRGMHLRENHVIAEIIGPDGKRLADGERGELVITTVGMEAMPLIRYRTGDYTRILPEPCPCGSSLIRLDGPGRDSLAEKLDGAVFSAEGVADFAAELTGGTLRLRILAAGSVDVRSVLEKAKSAVNMPVAIEEIREYSDDGTMLCPGKRKIINI